MAGDAVFDFLAELGIKVDSSAFAKAEAAAAQTEKRITAAQSAEMDRRIAAELKGSKRQVSIKEQLARLVENLEQDRADRVDAIQKDQAERAEKRDAEQIKHATERRNALLKSTRALTLGMFSLVKDLGIGVAGAATGLLWATERAAKHFERLAYTGQMSGSSATGLSRVSYAASQLGTTADDAQGSVAAFGESLKKLPALEGLLRSMGIATRDSNGQLRDASALMVEYINHLKELPQLQREARTGAWGITDTTTRAVLRPGFAGLEGEYDRIQGTVGADPNAAAQGAIGFEQAIRRGFEIIGAVKTRVETALFDLIKPRLDDISKWVLDHGDAISNVVTQISKGLTDLATAFVKSDVVQNALNGIGDGLERFAKYVASDDFKRDIHNFVDDVKALAHSIRSALEWLGVLPSRSGAAAIPNPEGDGDLEGGGGASLRNRRGSHRRDTDFDAVQGRLAGFGGGNHQHVSSSGRVGDLSKNPYATKENADSIRAAAKELGTTPEDLATVIGYETAGTFSPKKWGGNNRGYMGLIQFGGPERAEYGANENQSFTEQMGAVVRYLKGRGFKPGMGLMDLYSTVLAGSPGHYDRADVNGSVRSHVARMQSSHGPLARAFLAKGSGDATPAVESAAPSVPASVAPTQAAYDAATARSSDPNRRLIPLTPAMMKENDSDQAVITAWVKAHPAGPMAHHVGPIMDRGKEVVPGPEVRGKARGYKEIDDGGLAGLAGTTPDKPVKVEVTDHSAEKIGGHVGKALPDWMRPGANGPLETRDMRDPRRASAPFKSSFPAGTVPRGANTLADLHASWQRWVDENGKALVHPGQVQDPHGVPPLGVTPALHQAYDNSRKHGDTHITHNPTFHITGHDVKSSMDSARMVADRGTQDLVRNMRAVEQ